MKKLIAIAAIVLFVGAGFTLAAQRSWRGGWSHGFRGPEGWSLSQRILALLDSNRFRASVKLTDDQVTRLRQIVTNVEKSNIQTRAQMRVEGIDLRQLLESDKPDKSAVMKKVQEISELRGQMMKNNVQALLEAKAVLTPEQQDKVRQQIGARLSKGFWERNRRGQRRGRMMNSPGTPAQPPSPSAAPQTPGGSR